MLKLNYTLKALGQLAGRQQLQAPFSKFLFGNTGALSNWQCIVFLSGPLQRGCSDRGMCNHHRAAPSFDSNKPESHWPSAAHQQPVLTGYHPHGMSTFEHHTTAAPTLPKPSNKMLQLRSVTGDALCFCQAPCERGRSDQGMCNHHRANTAVKLLAVLCLIPTSTPGLPQCWHHCHNNTTHTATCDAQHPPCATAIAISCTTSLEYGAVDMLESKIAQH